MTQHDLPYLVVIGASGAEGLQDINELLRNLPQPTQAVIMVVLHRPFDRLSHLQQVLSRSCAMSVVVAKGHEHLRVNTCYIGRPDRHLVVGERNAARLLPAGGNALRNRTIDALFISAAHNRQQRTIGVILSGSLDDGSRGLAAIHAAHGLTMVLDPGYKPKGMQQNAIDYDGPISLIGSSRQIALGIVAVLAKDASRGALPSHVEFTQTMVPLA